MRRYGKNYHEVVLLDKWLLRWNSILVVRYLGGEPSLLTMTSSMNDKFPLDWQPIAPDDMIVLAGSPTANENGDYTAIHKGLIPDGPGVAVPSRRISFDLVCVATDPIKFEVQNLHSVSGQPPQYAECIEQTIPIVYDLMICPDCHAPRIYDHPSAGWECQNRACRRSASPPDMSPYPSVKPAPCAHTVDGGWDR